MLGVLLSLLLLAPSVRAERDTATLRVEITGVKSSQGGTIVVALYNGKENWLRKKRMLAVKTSAVTGDGVFVDFSDIAFGDAYALFIFHDVNENGKLDFRFFPIPRPREGIGVSNNAVRFGRPHFEKARFRVGDNQAPLHITMHY